MQSIPSRNLKTRKLNWANKIKNNWNRCCNQRLASTFFLWVLTFILWSLTGRYLITRSTCMDCRPALLVLTIIRLTSVKMKDRSPHTTWLHDRSTGHGQIHVEWVQTDMMTWCIQQGYTLSGDLKWTSWMLRFDHPVCDYDTKEL